ncbi:ATP-binding cassette domain-containing protein [Eisenibacter elegans]|jgi:ABC-type multidrug transport system ATPase subunit|uniref:ATP-binding cassette domain-containing protein n=1 Tax=Eisenibacter elegans TaxID=997 RepID=UPI0004231D5C|nr:ATP-binding cassette domain-containing protein [Eisenibacter elegans]
MSENILDALTRLFGIISKQDGGATQIERDFVITYFKEHLDQNSIHTYTQLYDEVADYGNPGPDRITMRESVKILKYCREINQNLAQGQKVVILTKLLELIATDGEFTDQRREIIDTVSKAFNIAGDEYKAIESYVINRETSQMSFKDILIVSSNLNAQLSNPEAKTLQLEKLDGEVIFLWVRSADMLFVKHHCQEEEILLNGFPIKPYQVYLYSRGSAIKTGQGKALYYSDITAIFLENLQETKLSFIAEEIEFTFPAGNLGLRGVSISETQGRLVGIMGGSGAGKTTLLNVLAGLETPSKGEVLINNIDIHKDKDAIEGVIGYVAQDDLLIEELTVYQNLYYNAKLCFNDLNEAEIDERVVSVLTSLGLDHIRHLKVGNPLNKKISGGQRKRLNIALELIREPAVMFVDEPTSGLSSRDSENVVDLLKEISLKGKLIFVVIHQPSLDIYKMFDRMIILDQGGYPIYYGDPLEAIPYFKKTANQVEGDRRNLNPEQIFNIIEDQVVNEYGQYTNKRKITPQQWNEHYKANFQQEKVEVIEEPPPSSLKLPNLFVQTTIFTIRDFLAKVGNTQYLLINLLEAPILALLMAFVIRFQNDPKVEGKYTFMFNDNIPAYILICVIIALFMGLTVSAEEIIKDRKIQKREKFLNLSKASYLCSKLIILFTLSAIQTLTFVVVGNAILEIKGELLNYWIILFSVSCFANVLGLNISSTFNSVVTIYITIPLLLIPQMILSGMIFSYDKMNDNITLKGKVPPVADIMVSRWAFEAMTVKQFKDNYYNEDYYQIEKTENYYRVKQKYWVPALREKVDRLVENYHLDDKNDSVMKVIEDDLSLLRNEISDEKRYHKFAKNIKIAEELTTSRFNEGVADKLNTYLDKVNDDATEQENKAAREREKVYEKFEAQDPKYPKIKEQYHNNQLSLMMKKEEVAIQGQPFIEHRGRLIQRIYPVFHEPKNPINWFDYSAHFFAPTKHFAGRWIDTYYYNLFVIWLLTFVLYLTLYFDVFKRIFNIFSRLGSLKS